MSTCDTCACVIEPFRLRGESCSTCAHRIPASIEVCDKACKYYVKMPSEQMELDL